MIEADSKRAMVYGIIAIIVSVFLMILLTGFRLLAPLDNRIYDLFMEYHAKGHNTALESEIVIVTIDEESLASIDKRWPWNRSYFARIINYLHKAEAKVIGVDLLFIESSDTPAEDMALTNALKKDKNIVIASKIEHIERNFIDDAVSIAGRRLVLPHPHFRDVTTYGLADLEYDTGSVIRTFKPYYLYNEKEYPAFATAIYMKIYGHRPILPKHSELYIDYLGGAGTFPSIPAYHIIKGLVSLKEFSQKIVLIGPTFSDAHDVFATPLTTLRKRCPGVEIQANILTTMFNNDFLVQVPRLPQVILVALLVILSGYLVMFHSAKPLFVTCSGVFVLVTVFSIWLLNYHSMIMDISYPILAMPLTFLVVSIPIRKPLVLETKVGPYRLLEEIGKGGMAVVYHAIHPQTHEEVALKQMLPQYASDDESLQRFLREIELIKAINHPNIIRIIDAGEIEGQPYYAMEFLKGSPLDAILKEQGRIETNEVRRIGGAIARALANAHDVGVIHRDIKPSNIILTSTGQPKLTDFGIAHKLDASNLTQTGNFPGTPSFIAPELCIGQTPSPASDIYSLGATLYNLLTGRLPFYHENIQAVFSMVLTQPPKEIRDVYPNNSDPELADIIMKCLYKDPKERHSSMIELARSLDPYYTEIELKSSVKPTTPDIPAGFDTAVIDPDMVTTKSMNKTSDDDNENDD